MHWQRPWGHQRAQRRAVDWGGGPRNSPRAGGGPGQTPPGGAGKATHQTPTKHNKKRWWCPPPPPPNATPTPTSPHRHLTRNSPAMQTTCADTDAHTALSSAAHCELASVAAAAAADSAQPPSRKKPRLSASASAASHAAASHPSRSAVVPPPAPFL